MRALGATTCTAHPKVLRNIAKQLEEYNVVSTQELQIALRMGIVATSPVGRAGFNDGILFPTNSPPVDLLRRPLFQKRRSLQSSRRNRKNGNCTPLQCWSIFPTTTECGGRRISTNYSLTKRTRIR